MQSSVTLYLPINGINQILFHFHISSLYSLYAFEYKWVNMGWNIKERLNYIETKWPYFFGFGLSLSLITSLSTSYVLNATLFAFLFPALLLSAVESDCGELNRQHSKPILFTSVHLFDLSTFITDRLFRLIKFLADKSRTKKTNSATIAKTERNMKQQFSLRKTN